MLTDPQVAHIQYMGHKYRASFCADPGPPHQQWGILREVVGLGASIALQCTICTRTLPYACLFSTVHVLAIDYTDDFTRTAKVLLLYCANLMSAAEQVDRDTQ